MSGNTNVIEILATVAAEAIRIGLTVCGLPKIAGEAAPFAEALVKLGGRLTDAGYEAPTAAELAAKADEVAALPDLAKE